MQAVISRTGEISRTVLVPLVLVARLLLGGVGGYLVSGLTRTAPGTTSVAHTSAYDALAVSATRHAATERAEADSTGAPDIALSMARHAATEREEANPSVLPAP